jgi:hypothetical protein
MMQKSDVLDFVQLLTASRGRALAILLFYFSFIGTFEL